MSFCHLLARTRRMPPPGRPQSQDHISDSASEIPHYWVVKKRQHQSRAILRISASSPALCFPLSS
jgi:hypothetical protein